MTIGPAEDRCEIAGGGRWVHSRRLQSRASVMEERDRARASRADDQIFLAVAVEIDPRDAGTEPAEGVRQQQLALIIVEVRLDVLMTAELGGGVFENRLGGLGPWAWGVC